MFTVFGPSGCVAAGWAHAPCAPAEGVRAAGEPQVPKTMMAIKDARRSRAQLECSTCHALRGRWVWRLARHLCGGRVKRNISDSRRFRPFLWRALSAPRAGNTTSMLSLVLASICSASPPPTPPQLDVAGFATCLSLGGGSTPHTVPELSAIKQKYDLEVTDGLLMYVAFYAGQRWPVFNATWQEPAYEKWSVPFWSYESVVASWLKDQAGPIVPGPAFGVALAACEAHYQNGTAPLCAALALHNVLRALGRNYTYVDKHGINYLPPWYKADPSGWQLVAARMEEQMISLQRDGQGCGPKQEAPSECWGEWYHTIGVLVFGIHEAALLGEGLGDLVARIAAGLNAVYQIITGGHEDPDKARIDMDAASVAAAYAAGNVTLGFDAARCARQDGYVLARGRQAGRGPSMGPRTED